jgi:phage antirepressor YoqD-like protein
MHGTAVKMYQVYFIEFTLFKALKDEKICILIGSQYDMPLLEQYKTGFFEHGESLTISKDWP